jgi:ElaA protein
MTPPAGHLCQWSWRAFDELSVFELQTIHRARQEVFVVEQQCAYLDADGLDERSLHCMGWFGHDTQAPASTLNLAAYARVVLPGYKYAEPSLGRVLTRKSVRGLGLGRSLLHHALQHCEQTFAGSAIRISAQSYLTALYAQFGFVAVGTPYLEDAIEHIEMWRPAVFTP